MAVLADAPDGTDAWATVKGAPDRLLDAVRPTSSPPTASTEPLDRARWDERIDALSAGGLRVLGAARRTARADVAGARGRRGRT